MRLGDVVSLIRGNTYKSSLLSETEGPILLGLGSIDRNGGYKYSARKHYPGHSDEKIILHPGDLFASLKDLTQKCELLGSVARVPQDVAEGRLTQDTVKLVFEDGATEWDKRYVYWSLRTPQYRAYCKSHGMGTTNMSLSREDFLSWMLPVRSKHNDLLVEQFELIDEKISVNNQINDYLLSCASSGYCGWQPFVSGPDSSGLHPRIPQSKGRLLLSCSQIPEAA